MNRKLILPAALVALLALVLAAVALGSPNRKIWCAGNICVTDDGGISPEKLPRHGSAPVTARLNGEISTRDGSHPPPFEAMDLKIDKTISLDAEGLPVCGASQISASTTATVKRVCGDAIVGSGKAEVEVAFPEQAPFRSTGPLVLFNGGVKGPVTTLLLHAYVKVPAPTAIVVKATITKIHEGRFGMRIQAAVPKIAGGAGSVTMFDLNVGRRYTYKGKPKSFLSASCPTGIWIAKGQASFKDGTTLAISHLFPCIPTD
ncbi:MAG TPA: hypothetical protein VKB23_11620 [Solirubrobacterales bacterium]|nr:hypothetical protein [Solirubrobacterales bacterium]